MQGQNIIRAILFVVFFSVGAASLGASVLCDDLVEYYRNRQLLKAASWKKTPTSLSASHLLRSVPNSKM